MPAACASLLGCAAGVFGVDSPELEMLSLLAVLLELLVVPLLSVALLLWAAAGDELTSGVTDCALSSVSSASSEG
jgi:hypothetical protein